MNSTTIIQTETETGTLFIEDFLMEPFDVNGDLIDPEMATLSDIAFEYIELLDGINEGKKSEIIRELLAALGDPAAEEKIYHDVWPFPIEKESNRPIWSQWIDTGEMPSPFPEVGDLTIIPTLDVITAEGKKWLTSKMDRLSRSDCYESIVKYMERKFREAMTPLLSIVKKPIVIQTILDIDPWIVRPLHEERTGFKIRDTILTYYRQRKLIELSDCLMKYSTTSKERRESEITFEEVRRGSTTINAYLRECLFDLDGESFGNSVVDYIEELITTIEDAVFEEVDAMIGTQ